MKLFEIMSAKVETIEPEAPLSAALRRMDDRDLHHLIVVDAGKVVGVLSARDRGDGQVGREVRDVMHTPVYAATTDTTVRAAAALLRGHSVGCLPVFEADRLVGIVTTSDLLEVLAGVRDVRRSRQA